MVKSYSRHGPTEAFGLVCSSSSNSIWDGKLAYVPALEDVLVWDVKRCQMIAMWHETGFRAEVTCIEQSPMKDVFAVGYADGSIRLWHRLTHTVTSVFNGHKRPVTALCFDQSGLRLASGSQDTELILWDVVGEAGLFRRLRGHRDQITGMRFLFPPATSASSSSSVPAVDFLLTVSKDTCLRLWDLTTQHCVQTVVAHPSEIWAMDVNPEQDLIFTGGGEGELKAWRINHEALSVGLVETGTEEITKMIHFVNELPISAGRRVSQLVFHKKRALLAVQSHDRTIDVFRLRSEEEIRKKQARRKRREREKARTKDVHTANNQESEVADMNMDVDDGQPVNLADLFLPYLVIRASGKIRSFYFSDESGNARIGIHLFIALATNAIEVYNIPTPSPDKHISPDASRLHSLDLPGHRTDVRTLCLSSDDQLLASASNESLKIWNLKTTACIRTLHCLYAICSTFLPGDRQIAVGTKKGEIFLYDVASSSLMQTIKAHSSTIWSMHMRPDEKILVTGSADKDVKFWEVEQTGTGSVYNQSVRSLIHVKTLKMTDDVLSVRYSPNNKLLAVSLLDSTVKIFYQDTLKFFLSLYGHKLPVLSMDISDDSKLIVTCSADKNVKIWGLDFGDCHKSIFAHDETIMQIAFEKRCNSRNFWTVGKDRFLKYWDGDKFEMIQKLEGHHGEIWALAVSHHGRFVVTGAHDRSIRVWEKLEESLFLEEERERELEQLYEGGVAETMNRQHEPIGSRAPGAESDVQQLAEATTVSKQTTETLMAGERIMEAIEIADAERAAMTEYHGAKANLPASEAESLQLPARSPILASYDLEPDEYVLMVIEKIQVSALMDSLHVLPFTKVVSLLFYLNEWARKGRSTALVSRIMVFVLKTHHRQIISQRTLRASLIPLRKHLRQALIGEKDIVGYNLAGLRYMKRQNDASKTTSFLDEQTMDTDKIKVLRNEIATGSMKKRKRVAIQA